MFPVIFTAHARALDRLRCRYLGAAVHGDRRGAVMPPLVGRLADIAGLRAAYLVPLVAYACISAFAFAASRARVTSQLTRQAMPPTETAYLTQCGEALATLKREHQLLRGWLLNDAYPLWATQGYDRLHGGFEESLTAAGPSPISRAAPGSGAAGLRLRTRGEPWLEFR